MTLPEEGDMELELETHSERLDECIARMETFSATRSGLLGQGRTEICPLSRGAQMEKAELGWLLLQGGVHQRQSAHTFHDGNCTGHTQVVTTFA